MIAIFALGNITWWTILNVKKTFLASPDAQEVIVVSEWVTLSGLADLTDVTDGTCVTHDHLSSVIESNLFVSDDTFRRLCTWVTHDHLSSVIESNRLEWCDPSEWWYL